MLRIHDIHTDLIGKVCKLTAFGLELEKEYEQVFGFGSYYSAFSTYEYCHFIGHKYELWLMFIDEKPFTKGDITWYCVKEIGFESTGDWHWYTLNQLMICSAEGIKERYLK